MPKRNRIAKGRLVLMKLCVKLAFVVGLVFGMSSAGFAQDWAKAKLDQSPRHREYVVLTHGGRKVNAYVAYPEVRGKAPVVVMIHEIFGLTDWARLMADEVAAKGYIVVEPDLLSGMGPGGGGTESFGGDENAVKGVSKLDPAQVMADLNAAADYGEKLPSASGKLAVAGFCWGGGKSFAFATERKDLSAAFVFYGPPPPVDAMGAIHARVYGFYAGNDARISATVPATREQMKVAGKTYDAVIYDGAGHGFMRAGQAPDASAPNQAAWEQGFARFTTELAKLK